MQLILDSRAALAQLSRYAFPATVAYRLNKNQRLAEQEYSHFDEARIKILKELGTLNEKGTDYDLEPEQRKVFEKQIAELLATEVEINFMTVPLSKLANTSIPPAAIGALEDIVITLDDPLPAVEANPAVQH